MNNKVMTYDPHSLQRSAGEFYGKSSEKGDGYPVSDGQYQECSLEEMYGSHSYVVASQPVEPIPPTFSAEPTFQALVAVTLIAYLYMMFRSWDFISSMWSNRLIGKSERRMANEAGTMPLLRFKIAATLLGGVCLALIGVRLIEGIIPTESIASIGDKSPLVPLIAMLLVMVVVAWNYAFHEICSWVTRSDAVEELASIGFMNFVRSVVILYPIIAVWLVAKEDTLSAMNVIVSICSLLLFIIYLKDTFLFFIEKKIPILHWILYLCTAILLPLSFLAVLLPEKLG